MQKLVHGIHQFQSGVFSSKRELFRNLLSRGQNPAALFITCSDARVNPNLLTQTEPGDLFLIRNAGNIIPAAPAMGGEIATMEFALVSLGIQDIIVCGHSDCGAMKGVLDPSLISEPMPALTEWLGHASRTAEIVASEYSHLHGAARLTATVEENVIVQIENLRTHAFVQERIERGTLRVHGWVYKFETGEVFSYDPESGQFVLLQVDEEVRPVYPRCVGDDTVARAMAGGDSK